jgi:hypothetical protein
MLRNYEERVWQFVGILLLIGFVGAYRWLIALTAAAFYFGYWVVSRALETNSARHPSG